MAQLREGMAAGWLPNPVASPLKVAEFSVHNHDAGFKPIEGFSKCGSGVGTLELGS